MIDWTGKVDQKASFALTVQSAVLLAVVGFSSATGVLSGLRAYALGVFYVGVLALVAGVGCAGWAVIPQIRAKVIDSDPRGGFIFFGHLKNWTAADLEVALRDKSRQLPVLADQLVKMGEIAWAKHRRLQFSMYLGAGGSALVVLAEGLHRAM